MDGELKIAEEAVRSPEQRARRKAELGTTSIRETILGTASYLTHEQKRRVKAYREGRVTAGKIFGARTEELLGTDGTIDERIKGYFERVNQGFNDLGEIYGLKDRMHAGGGFEAIKEEAMRLMWVYGIKTEIFTHDQEGLLLLGAASTNLHLKGKGESYARERKRMGQVIRMIADSFKFRDTSAVKVTKWVEDARNKADKEKKPTRQRMYQTRAAIEQEYTKDRVINEEDQSVHNQAIEVIDQAATEYFNAHYREMPHLVRVQERLGLKEIPSIEWVITRYSQKEFEDLFKQGALHSPPYIYLSRDINTPWAEEAQQHEFHHAVTFPTYNLHLGWGMREADAERIVDNPTDYNGERLLGYFVDDIIDNKFQLTGADNTYTVRQQASIKAKQGINGSDEERTWNTRLLDGFGLEGYLTYYMEGFGKNYPDYIKKQLLDVPTAAYRMVRYADAYKSGTFTSLPNDLYGASMRYQDLLEKDIAIISNGNNKMIPDYFADPTKTTMQYSPETLAELAERVNAWGNVDNTNQRSKSIGLKLEELAWMKQRYPDSYAAMDSTYSVSIDVLKDIPQQNASFSEQEFGNVQKLIKQAINHMSTTAIYTGSEFDNTLKYIMLRLSSGDYATGIDEDLQRKVGQALATAYRRFDDAMPGRTKDVAIEMRYIFMEPIIKDGATLADFQTLLHNLERVGA